MLKLNELKHNQLCWPCKRLP